LTDAVRLKQTIVNLVGNAIKFTDKGSVSIEVAYLDDTDKPMLRIDVVDTGIGISPESLQRIFSPFAQADTSITRRFGGTGLGLSISKQLAKSMGGGIEVTSVENQGSRFSVRLAIGDTTGVRLVELESARRGLVEQIRPVAELKVRFPGTKILVADDGESNRKLVKLVLTRAGAEVVLAENGQQAVDAVLRETFDLVLMDMQMPIMDGYAATTTLRKLGVRLPIIALTAHAMQGDEDKCRGAGCSGFLTKPIQIDRLLTCIADELGIVGVEPTEAELLEQVRNLRDEVQTASSSPTPTEHTALVSTLPIEDAEFREIVAEFVTRLLERFERMQSACESGDFVTLASHAHWLKGSGGTAGFAILTEPARTLESAAKRGSSEDAATAMQEIASLIGRISHSPCVSIVTDKP
jgi:CheY-like chemotaxis protein